MSHGRQPTRTRSLFDGTWRPHYEPPGPEALPDVLSLRAGIYACESCRPPYRVRADGREHAVKGNPRFDGLEVTVVDDRTVRLVGRRAKAMTYESTMVVAADGSAMTETRTAAMQVGGAFVALKSFRRGRPRLVMFRISSARAGSMSTGAHLVSGSWRVLELDLLNHDEDTTYRLTADSLTMSDRLGRSYSATLDGAVAPYVGDVRFTGVSVRQIDERTIEESNLNGDEVLQVTTWRVGSDGRTMHVRFDDRHGHVMEQTGYKCCRRG